MDQTREAVLDRLRELSVRYMTAHKAGVDALARLDLNTVDAAIQAETDMLIEQRALVALLRQPPPE